MRARASRVDSVASNGLLPLVPRRVFTVVAWLLVALWLPAALHCTAETSGVFGRSECCATASDDQGETADHCVVIEAGAPRQDESGIRTANPALVVLQILRAPLCLLAASGEAGLSPAVATPPEIARLWRAVERVVALSQAP